MSPDNGHVIIGANLTGGRAAEALRESGFDGHIVLVGAEPDRPYERPPLSKEYLRGEKPEAEIYLRPPDYYEQQRIELRLGVRATRLDPAHGVVELASSERLAYDRLLIATGCKVRRLDVAGAELEGVHYLRTRADSAVLATLLQGAGSVVVVGAGFIGSEVAASARALGKNVSLVEASAAPLERALGARMGEVCAQMHRDHGVDVRLSNSVQAFRGAGRVEEIVLEDGSSIPCDLVVVGVGVTPATEWLVGSGVELDNGVLVNEYCETNLHDVYAAGDVANAWNPLLGERLRVEHYDNAQNQGIAAGRVMAGFREAYAPIPYFWSDQYEYTMQFVGSARGHDDIALRGDLLRYSFTAFYLREGRVRAAFSIGRPRDIMAARRLIRVADPVDSDILADERNDLRALAR